MTGSGNPTRPWKNAGFVVALAAFLGLIFFLGTHGSIGQGGYPFMAAYLLAHGAMVALWITWPLKRGSFAAICFLAVAARALMFPFPLSDDVNRYVWEGKIQGEGYNPFILAPDAEVLEPLRDENWEGINHKDYPTIYPGAAQLTFRYGYALWPDGRCLRLFFTVFDLGTLLVLFGLVRAYRTETRHLLFYALNPLVLLYVAGEGHLDPTAVFFVMAALLAWKREREGTAFFLLGMGVMFKMLPIVFFPLFMTRRNWKKAFLFFVPCICCLPYLNSEIGLLDTTALFASTFYYNAFLFSLLQPWMSNPTAVLVCWTVFGLAAMAIFFLVPNLLRACFLMVGVLLFTMQVLHPWYFVLLVPFLTFFRSWPWMVLLAAVAATFVTRIHQVNTGDWYDAPWARIVEFGTVFLCWGWCLFRGRVTGPESYPTPQSVSVVIPVLNESASIAESIASVQAQHPPPGEIIVVDGGSEDRTCERVRALEGVKFVETEPGRGIQIAAGVKHAGGDLIVVLHGDSRLFSNAFARMMKKLAQNPAAVGGAFGHAYVDSSMRLASIALLDNLRARLLGISFGNQAQFFRRHALPGGFPALRLMEDVELSFRMKTAGATVYIPHGVANRPRRWEGRGFLGKVGLVLSLTGRFIAARRLGFSVGQGERFYKRYYGS